MSGHPDAQRQSEMRVGSRVLMVVNSEDRAGMLAQELRRNGIDLEYDWVDNAQAVLAALDREPWDIVIGDYTPAQTDGLTSLQAVKETDPDLPFIYVSRIEGEGVAVAALRSGADDYVQQDQVGRLASAVERALGAAEGRRRQRETESQLRESEARYRSLIEIAPDAILVTDLEGRITMANERAAQLQGCASVAELLGRDAREFLIPDDHARLVELADEVLDTKEVATGEYALRTKDGALLSAEVSAAVIVNSDGEPIGFVSVLRDVTEQVKNREEIRRLKEFNEGIVQSMAEGIVLQDAQGYVTFVNPAAAALLGYTPEALVGKHWTEMVPEDQHGVVQSADDRRVRGETDRYELALLHRAGRRVPVQVGASPRVDAETGQFLGTMAVFTDIGERQRVEAALRQRNRELALLNRVSRALSLILDPDILLLTVLNEVRRALNVAATSLWLTDPTTGELVCREATGPQREDVQGWRLAPGEGIAGWVASTGETVIVPDTHVDRRHFKGVDQRIGLRARSILSVPLRARQDVIGALQVVDTEVDRFSESDQALMEALAATAAIAIENARMFAEEEQRAAELTHALQRQRDLDYLKDQFIQNVSHELRTPLSLVQAYAELLVSGELGSLKRKQSEPVAVIARRAKMLGKIVEDLTAILETETQEPEWECVDFSQLIRNLLSDFQVPAARAGVDLRADMEPDLPPIWGSTAHLYRMLDNLLGNALKFTAAGGRVTVRLRRRDEELVLEVRDTGIGIPEDQQERVFERFYQVDGTMSRRYGGAGLGLALVKEVVEAHRGRVAVRSGVGEGSTFEVCLPVSAA